MSAARPRPPSDDDSGALRGALYRRAVRWIVANDPPTDDRVEATEAEAARPIVKLVADLFGYKPADVAVDVLCGTVTETTPPPVAIGDFTKVSYLNPDKIKGLRKEPAR